MSVFGVPAPIDKTATLDDDDYVELGMDMARQLLQLRSQNGWNLTTWGDDNSTVFTRKNGLPGAKENMLLLTTVIDAPSWILEELIAPWGEYRLRWDDLLDDIEILATLPKETYIVHHIVKKRITLSVRESVDVVQVHRYDNRIVFASCGTSHASTPESSNYTRTHQYIGGYVLDTLNDSTTRLSMIFNADLNLPGPKMLTSLMDRFKPKLMLENARALRSGLKKFRDEIEAKRKTEQVVSRVADLAV